MNGQVALAKAPSLATANRNIPAFLQKLYKIINDPSTDRLIRWNDLGDSFIVLHHEDFARELLPRYYKHAHFASFVRQLNMYGFHKVPHIEDNGNAKSQQDQVWEFSNPNFLRDQPDLLALVTRKKTRDPDEKDGLDYNSIMHEIQAIKRHQMSISQDLKRIQSDNQSLWQEQADTRARHSKHQETIEKILTFLGTVYGNQYNSEDKSLQSKPKKRRLLLEDDQSGTIKDLGLQDERTKETFEDMFRSASASPTLRPLKQPATELASSPQNASQETRFTMPGYDTRQQMAKTSAPRPAMSNHAYNNLAKDTNPQISRNSQVSNTGLRNTLGGPPDRDRNDLDLSLALSPAIKEQLDPANMQLTTTSQRLLNNDASTKELQEKVLMTDESIETLANLLGVEVHELGNLNANDLYNPENDFDQFMNPNASYAGTPLSGNAFDTADNTLPYSSDPFSLDAARYDMNPPLYVPGSGAQNTQHAAVNGLKSGSATATPSPVVSAPGSSTGSVKAEEEEIEEIDMDRARGKKRKSEG